MLPNKIENSTIIARTSNPVPARIVEVELGQPLAPIISAIDAKTGRYYQRILCLVRLHSYPLGIVELYLDGRGMSVNDYAAYIWRSLHMQINEHLREDGLPAVTGLNLADKLDSITPPCLEKREQFLSQAPFVSVVVPTHNRLERLRACLHSLLALRYPRYEVIVVDNAPSTTATADYIQQTYGDVPQVRYVREDPPGPSHARNCGIRAAKGEIVAFVDDDVVVDPHWLVELVRGFSLADDVACVTGLVLPLELETAAQVWFEEYGGFSKGFSQHIFDMREHHPQTPLYPYTAGRFGTGASMAFTSAFLHTVNGFDIILAGNSRAPGAEDVDLFFKTVMRGYKLVYMSTSIVFHQHRRDYTALCNQIYHYGVGISAHLMKIMLENPRLLLDLITRVPHGLYYALSMRSSKNSKKTTTYPKELTMLELKGMLYGPLSYLRSWWVMRNVNKALIPSEPRISMPVEEEG